jgi:hypothetical protein
MIDGTAEVVHVDLGVVGGFGGGVVGGFGGGVSLGLGVDSGTFVTDISVVTVGVSGVGHELDTAVGKVDTVRSGCGISITSLLGLEVGVAVVVSDGVGVLVKGSGIRVCGFLIGGRGMVSRGCIRGWGISWGWGMVSHGDGDKGEKCDL